MGNDHRNDVKQEPIFIHFNSISVELRPGVNMDFVSDIVRVLQNQC